MNEEHLSTMAEYYNKWWENPEDPRGKVFAKLTHFIGERIPEGKGKKALDLGSGEGAIVEQLVKKGYDVTAVEYRAEAVKKLQARFPQVRVVQADLNQWEPTDTYDMVTMAELIQNFNEEETRVLLHKVRKITQTVLVNIPNLHSLQGRWVTWRKFKASFVYLYTPEQFETLLNEAGFKIKYHAGIGFLMPITLLSHFRLKLIPQFVVKFGNKFLDPRYPKKCALYYMELE